MDDLFWKDYTPTQMTQIRDAVQKLLDTGKLDEEQAKTATSIMKSLEAEREDKPMKAFNEDEMIFLEAVQVVLWSK